MSPKDDKIHRRTVLALGTVVAATSVACGEGDAADAASSGQGSGGDGAAGGSDGGGGLGAGGTGGTGGAPSGMCQLTPVQIEGPFYLDDDLVRQDIAEGYPGVPLRVVIDVVALPDCSAVADVPVDIWHCTAGGVYSGYPGQLGGLDTTGETFLRGTQISDASGRVEFITIYPGWYPGRTTHIHFKVHWPANMEVTSQMYFDDAVSAEIYLQSPYDQHGAKDTANSQDGADPTLMVELATDGSGYVATLTVGVQG